MPRLGTFNLHASLLPQYRGAAPINWAVINGDTETGITTFFLKHEIDTGEVIQQVRVPIADTDNVEVVHDKLMMLGGKLVLETVDAILNGTVKPISEEEMAVVGELRPAPKIFKETCRIDWNQPVKKIYDFIRGLSPYPAAWSELIASENFVSDQVMQAMGSCLTNKYAEGYPGKRYYGGCEVVDQSETIAIERLKKLFNAEWANVQPHSGAQANAAVFFAVLNPGDTFLGLNLSHGGHLSHGSPVNSSGVLYHATEYNVKEDTGRVDYDQMEEVALREKPKLICLLYTSDAADE